MRPALGSLILLYITGALYQHPSLVVLPRQEQTQPLPLRYQPRITGVTGGTARGVRQGHTGMTNTFSWHPQTQLASSPGSASWDLWQR